MELHRHISHVGGFSGLGILLALAAYMCCHLVTNTSISEADFGILQTDLTYYEPVLLTVHCTCAQS
jgi:hypothetical protein